MKLISTALLLLAGSLGNLYAQRFFTPGYALTPSGDTLKGEFRQKSNTSLSFRASPNAPETAYTSDQIASFVTEGTLSVSARWDEDGQTGAGFLREWVRGYVSLYRLSEAKDGLEFVLRTPTGTFVPLRGKMAWSKLNRVFGDCTDPKLAQDLQPQLFRYDLAYFERLVRQYNRCMKPDEQVVASRAPFHYEIGVLAGLARTRWNYRFPGTAYIDPRGLYPADYSPTVGGFITILPRKRLSLSLEVWYGQYEGTQKTTVAGFPERYVTYHFREQFLGVPLLANYALLQKRTRLLVRGGLLLTSDFTLEGDYNSPYYSIDQTPLSYKKSLGVGYMAGLAGEWKVGRRRLRAEVRGSSHLIRTGATRLAFCNSFQAVAALPLFER